MQNNISFLKKFSIFIIMEKVVGIIGDQNNELSNVITQEFRPKYEIYEYSYCSDDVLILQTNDKELFIKEWADRSYSFSCCDDIGLKFKIGQFGGGGFMNEKALRKYLEEIENKTNK